MKEKSSRKQMILRSPLAQYSLLFLATILLFFPLFSYADDSEDCVDIVSHAEEKNWNYVFFLEEEKSDGVPKMWQRAVLGVSEKDFKVKEDIPVKIWGTATPGAKVQIYYWEVKGKTDDERDSLNRPSTSTCSMVTANNEGIFVLEINSSFFWRYIGKNLAVDAFFRTNIPVEEYHSRNEARSVSQVGVMGHFFPLVILSSAGGETSEECENHPSCSENGMIRSRILKKSKIPEVAQSTSNYFLNDLEINRITDSHTFYANFADGTTNDADVLQKQTHKTFIMEILKRLLLANKNTKIEAPGLARLDKAELERAIEENGVSEDVHDVATFIRAMLTSPNGRNGNSSLSQYDTNSVPRGVSSFFGELSAFFHQNTFLFLEKKDLFYRVNGENSPPPPPPPPSLIYRDEAARKLKEIIDQVISPETIDESLLKELFPQQKTDIEKWQNDFLALMSFWTGKLEENTCLLSDDDGLGKNFKSVNSTEPLCEIPYVSGATPSLVLNMPEAILLHPEFQNTILLSANINFLPHTETWFFPSGKKETLHYTYSFSESSSHLSTENAFVCLTNSDISDFSKYMENQLMLSSQEREALEYELSVAMEVPSEHYQISFANTEKIAQHFSWWGNGKKLHIAQLFFHAEKGQCSETVFSAISKTSISKDRDGFEVGILQ